MPSPSSERISNLLALCEVADQCLPALVYGKSLSLVQATEVAKQIGAWKFSLRHAPIAEEAAVVPPFMVALDALLRRHNDRLEGNLAVEFKTARDRVYRS